MNKKLKQSLEGRLGGMRWGERDQEEVFRQIQRKELQDVKHIKRGTGLIAIAIAMLFIIMGASLALTMPPQPEDTRVTGQITETPFLPVPAAQYENEYFILTIDSAAIGGSEASFTATICMKDPDTYMLFELGGHTPPGDPNRTPVRVSLRATAETVAEDLRLISGCDLSSTPDVLFMSSDAATFRMSGKPSATGAEMHLTLYVTWLDPATGKEHTDAVRWTMSDPAPMRMTLLENKYITCTLTERRIEGTQGTVIIDITPSKPWYALNRAEDGKATLQVHCEEMAIYACSDHDVLMDMVERRVPPLGGVSGRLEAIPGGLRYTMQGDMPMGHDALLGYLVVSVSPEAEAIHDPGDLPHYAELILPLPIPEQDVHSLPTPTAAPQPANAMWLLENELVTAHIIRSELDGDTLHITIDITPKNPEHVINKTEAGKTRLTISTQWYGGYDGETPLRPLSVGNPQFVATDQGARLTASLPFPEKYDVLSYNLHVKTTGAGAEYENHLHASTYRPGTYVTASPTPTTAPIPSATPRPTPSGNLIGGDDIVSVYMEKSWSDGFTTEATLRIRADDPAHLLAMKPNQNGTPDSSTWVIRLEDPDDNSGCSISMRRDDATGDLLADVTFFDPYDFYQDGLLDLMLTSTNELTWESYSNYVRPVTKVEKLSSPKPLHLISSTRDDLFIQGSVLTTSRYHYIGVMMNQVPGVRGSLMNADGTALVSDTVCGISGMALKSFSRVLFPFEGDDNAKLYLLVLRIDRAITLPDLLPIQLSSKAQNTDMTGLVVSTNPALQPTEQSVIFNTPLLVGTLLQLDFQDGHAAGRLQICLKDPLSYTFDPDDPIEARQVIQLTPALCAYNGDSRPTEYIGDFTIVATANGSVCDVMFYGSFPDWHSPDGADPWCIALLSAQSAGSSFSESYNAEFHFPQRGSITRLPVTAGTDASVAGFDLASGELIQTDYLNVLSLRWKGDANTGMLYKGNAPADILPTITIIRGHAPDPADTTEQHKEYFLTGYDESATYSVLVWETGTNARMMYPLQIGSQPD